MNEKKLLDWCQKATEQIRYKPDRKAVAAELMAHMEDAYEAQLADGYTPAEATQKTLEAMGSAEEIAPQLAKLHKPWLGYLSSIIKAIAILTAALAIYCYLISCGSFLHTLVSTRNFDSIPVNHGPLDYYCHPNVIDSSDGYRLQITEAGYSKIHRELYFQLETIHWPWMGHGNIYHRMWAVDSFGNFYDSQADAQFNDPTRVIGGGGMGSSLIFIYDMRITGFDCDAQWVELHYDLDGRDIVLRIDLTGGGENE